MFAKVNVKCFRDLSTVFGCCGFMNIAGSIVVDLIIFNALSLLKTDSNEGCALHNTT